MLPLQFFLVVGFARNLLLAAHAQQRLGQQHQHRIRIGDGGQHQAVSVEGVARHDDLPARQPAGPTLEGMGMVQTAADAGAARRHHHDGHLELAGAGPALIAGYFQEVNGVKSVVAELNFGHGPAAGVSDAHGRADDAALVER